MSLTTEPRTTSLRLRARRPAAFNVVFRKADRLTRVDVTGATLTFVMGDVEQDAEIVAGEIGMFRIDLQADDLNLRADRDYPFDLRLRTASGFVCSVLTGFVTITFNPDTSVPVDYDPASIVPDDTLMVTMRDRDTFVVQTDHTPDLVLASFVAEVEIMRSATLIARDEAVEAAAVASGVEASLDEALEQLATVEGQLALIEDVREDAIAAQSSAAASASAASGSAVTAASRATAASTSATQAAASAAQASSSEGSAAGSSASAAAYAGQAASSATSAQAHRDAALGYRNDASAHATTALDRAVSANSSKVAAEAARDLAQTYRDEALAASSALPLTNLGTGIETLGGQTIDAQKAYTISMSGTVATTADFTAGSGWAHGSRAFLRVVTTNDVHQKNTVTVLGEVWNVYGASDRVFEIRQIHTKRFITLVHNEQTPDEFNSTLVPGGTLSLAPGTKTRLLLDSDVNIRPEAGAYPWTLPIEVIAQPGAGSGHQLGFLETEFEVETTLNSPARFIIEPTDGNWRMRQLTGGDYFNVGVDPFFGTPSGGGGGGASALADLTDVDLSGVVAGKVLGFDGSTWVPVDADAAPEQVEAIMPDLVATSSSSHYGPYVPANAFDGVKTYESRWLSDGGFPVWLRGDFALPTVVDHYTIYSMVEESSRNPKDWSLQGSNNGTSWTTLDVRAGVTWTPGEAKTFELSGPAEWTMYRVLFTANQGGDSYVHVRGLEFQAYLDPDVTPWSTIPRTLGLSDPTNDSFLTVDIADDGSDTSNWIDRLRFRFVGKLTSWFNEYGEFRAVSAKVNTVAMRLFTRYNDADAAHDPATPVFEVVATRQTRTNRFSIMADGSTVQSGKPTLETDGGTVCEMAYYVTTVGATLPADLPDNILVVRK